MENKYLFFDIDGTLMAGGYENIHCPESCLYALKKLREKGIFSAIATGRSHALSEDIMHELGFKDMVHDGGYGITMDDKLVHIEPLNYQYCLELAKECDEKGFPYGISPYDSVYRLSKDERFFDFTHDTYMETKVVPGLDIHDFDQIIKMYIACNRGEEDNIVSLQKLPHARFHDTYLFVEPTDKSRGIKQIVDRLGGNYKDVIVFGDASNDLSMFIDEWTCVAMGNAIDELKEKADYVTTDADNDGIYNALVHFGLIEDDFYN